MDHRALELAIGSLGGDYELIRELGRGATSIVYLLRDHGLRRTVAMKVIRTGIGSDSEAIARLEREAHLVAQLQHPNIVKLYGTHRFPDGAFVLLMEHVPGRNLKEVVQSEGALPIPLVLEILTDVASALAYAHRRRIVHRDVKPENIYIDEEVGAARLADFGVARPWDQDSRLTLPGASLGTPAYMSPEQIDGREVDGRSDVYSLGLVGYEMILGRHPWEGENVFTTIFKQKSETLSLDLPGLSIYPSLADLLERSLRKDPEERWPTAGELLAALRHVTPSRRRDDPAPWIPEMDSAPGGEREGEKQEIDWSGLVAPADDAEGVTLPLDSAENVALARRTEDSVAEVPAPPALPGGPRRRVRRHLAVWGWAVLALLAASYGGHRWLAGLREPAAPPPVADEPPPATRVLDPVGGASLRPLGTGRVEGRVGTEAVVTVQATGPDGAGLANALVGLRVVEGEFRLAMDTVRTGATGLGEARLALPSSPGVGVVEAALLGSENPPIRIQVTALAGFPHSAVVFVGEGQSAGTGEVLPEFVGVRVLDELGNPVSGARVGFRPTEGGQARPGETVTDDVGRAFVRWVLGPRAGSQSLEVVVPGAGDSIIVLGATAVATAPSPASAPSLPAAAPAAPRPDVRAVGIGVGGSHVCLLQGGSPWCRGSTDRGQDGGRTVQGLRSIAAGGSHSCALDVQGVAWCWGANESGQVGDGTTQDRATGVLVQTDERFALLAGGLSHTCGLDGAGSVHCWGRNLNGQLGDGTRADRAVPGSVSAGGGFRSVVAGWNHTCGLDGSGRAVCWGGNAEGQLGDGTRVDRLTPAVVPGRFQALAAGAGHTCGISGGQVLCWGNNGFGQLGDGTTEDRQSAVVVEGLPAVPVALTAGAVHTCALLEGGAAYCWGQNLHGQLGDGTTNNSTGPVPVTGEIRFLSLHAGGGMTCGSDEEGSTYCWGLNQAGQLGDGTRTSRSSPVRVEGG